MNDLSSDRFTKSFQNALTEYIGDYLRETLADDLYTCLNVASESKPPFRTWEGRADIWIGRRKKPETDSWHSNIVIIEIEQWNSPGQALTNVEQVIKWAHRSKANKASLIHLLHADGYIKEDRRDEIFSRGYEARSNSFNYDFRVYPVKNYKASRKLAQEFIDNHDFRHLLWQHLKFAGIV